MARPSCTGVDYHMQTHSNTSTKTVDTTNLLEAYPNYSEVLDWISQKLKSLHTSSSPAMSWLTMGSVLNRYTIYIGDHTHSTTCKS